MKLGRHSHVDAPGTIFLTGAAGFIARAVRRRAEVEPGALEVIPVPRADAARFIRAHAPERQGPSALLHLAWPGMRAASSGAGAASEDERSWQGFVDWSQGLRDACADTGTPFIGVGSGVEAYAFPNSGLDEPYLGYARRKAALREALGDDTSWLRLHFIFGRHEFSHRVVPSAIRAALAGAELVSNSRDRRRHWLHVDDAAAAMVAFAADPKPGIWDIAGDEAISYDELFALVEQAVGQPLRLSYTNAKTADGDLKLIAPTNPAPVLAPGAGSPANLLARLTEYANSTRAEPWRKTMARAHRVHACRLCHGPLGSPVLSLGDQPLSNRFPRVSETAVITSVLPLEVSLCEDCGLVQLASHVDASEHFHDDYNYVSGASSTWVAHCALYAQDLMDGHGVSTRDFVVEVGSNDGTLLKALAAEGVRGLGVEPSTQVAELARRDGVETLARFFDAEAVEAVKRTHGRPKALIGNNVLAVVPDPDAFLKAARDLIAEDGFMCFEFPHFAKILERRYFDAIYHEHYTYLGVGPLLAWARRNGMEIYAVDRQPIHGGSLRVFMRRGDGAPPPIVSAILEEEGRLSGPEPWRALDAWLKAWREEFRAVLAEMRLEGKVVVGYAAASKATVVCNYLGLTAADIPYCCDASPLKQGRTIPGTGIPIVSPEALKTEPPDVVIVFAWNIFNEIARSLAGLTSRAVPIVRLPPEPEALNHLTKASA